MERGRQRRVHRSSVLGWLVTLECVSNDLPSVCVPPLPPPPQLFSFIGCFMCQQHALCSSGMNLFGQLCMGHTNGVTDLVNCLTHTQSADTGPGVFLTHTQYAGTGPGGLSHPHSVC